MCRIYYDVSNLRVFKLSGPILCSNSILRYPQTIAYVLLVHMFCASHSYCFLTIYRKQREWEGRGEEGEGRWKGNCKVGKKGKQV